jgi:hypothetical protein
MSRLTLGSANATSGLGNATSEALFRAVGIAIGLCRKTNSAHRQPRHKAHSVAMNLPEERVAGVVTRVRRAARAAAAVTMGGARAAARATEAAKVPVGTPRVARYDLMGTLARVVGWLLRAASHLVPDEQRLIATTYRVGSP